MIKNSAIVAIVDSYDKFTEVEKLIADYFIKNKHKEDFSIKNIKNKLHVSESSITRFSQKCGFKGYREFIYRYEEGFLKGISKSSFNVEEVLNTYGRILNMFPSLIDNEQIDKIADLIIKSKSVLFVGIGSSGLVAREMQSRLTRLGILVMAIDSRWNENEGSFSKRKFSAYWHKPFSQQRIRSFRPKTRQRKRRKNNSYNIKFKR